MTILSTKYITLLFFLLPYFSDFFTYAYILFEIVL